MSAGYASRLKEYPDKGVCGLPELKETKRSFTTKIKRLVELFAGRPRVVVFTGAGVSTAAGIPDFRGPNGIWTLEKKSSAKKRKREEPGSEESSSSSRVLMDFSHATPSLTHRAITYMVTKGLVQFCITQNVDGLHRRSGLPRAKQAVLHGCVFTEKCEDCHTEHFRQEDVGGMSFQTTGRNCEECRGNLRDTLLDWEDALPEDDFDRATFECAQADIVLSLGTSLRIQPAGELPSLAKQFVIVNLQETPYDKDAALVIRAKVDDVMQQLLEGLGHGDWEKNFELPPVETLSKQPSAKGSP